MLSFLVLTLAVQDELSVRLMFVAPVLLLAFVLMLLYGFEYDFFVKAFRKPASLKERVVLNKDVGGLRRQKTGGLTVSKDSVGYFASRVSR
ncbi:MAG: hypothetical protein ACE5DI_04270 [Candidatus Micrarchaeia archaeon]